MGEGSQRSNLCDAWDFGARFPAIRHVWVHAYAGYTWANFENLNIFILMLSIAFVFTPLSWTPYWIVFVLWFPTLILTPPHSSPQPATGSGLN